ncbi:hypothetical protein MRB53_033640 [Persea americana]|uniref:Uncharacterized protein n=1 Tax=Persea americana TaxID=3435 RepID=A0ACC2KVC6_PERAE|nr:hypothetical protein MRB53_033640 [Persea americana]
MVLFLSSIESIVHEIHMEAEDGKDEWAGVTERVARWFSHSSSATTRATTVFCSVFYFSAKSRSLPLRSSFSICFSGSDLEQQLN